MTAPRSRRAALPARLVNGVWLLLVWLAVTGSYTVASLLGGIAVVTLLMLLFRQETVTGEHHVRPLMLARYVWYFVSNLVLANVHVARAVLVPGRVRDRRGIVAVPLQRSSRLVQAVLANAVSLTPGTSIIEVTEEPPSLHVHVLELESVDEVRRSVAELHWRLVRAIGPDDALPAVTEAVEDLRRRVEQGAPS